MGNSNSTKGSGRGSLKKKSESMEIRSNKSSKKVADFNKSRSMMDMGSRSRGGSAASSSTRKKSITSIKEKDRPKSARDLKSSSLYRSKSIKKDAAHPITSQGREIITQCFENPHSEFANKVLQRIFEKRADYQKFILTLGKDRSYIINLRLKQLVEDIVARIHDAEYIENVSRQYGEEHVELKQYGFKPDFWVAVADAMTLEGVILDMASHQPADTVSAWSSLVTMIFSAVRDGYYSELRRHRMSSRRTLRQNTIDSNNDCENEPTTSLANQFDALNMANGDDDISQGPSSSSTHLRRPVTTMRSLSCYSSDSATSQTRRNDTPSMSPSTTTTQTRIIFE